ncbi:Ivy family c-type lysozyme inhibitor [Paracoccus aminophilus]|uniref:Inhibitor of vertebrate lysozyme n=1 Tax=Paracoccus aminophilus JCM 7686 TaxID=1367847 RepID=S5Z1G7_PARAH|nr:Ivy family c-type lysozyme inhibitor [Paracoccus aminophilus]AGT11286.1 hypothetical protein JCM7686_pAMI5p220 [Paracoccus aminophilus JCM 7686]
MLSSLRAAGALALILGLTPAAFAESAEPTLADLSTNSEMRASFDKMATGWTVPDWVLSGPVTSPSQMVQFGGKEYLVMTGCKKHDCGNNQIAVLYQKTDKVMFGLLLRADSADGPQTLNWMGMGGNAETVDGRTILYAATTGSLANHPKSFDYTD